MRESIGLKVRAGAKTNSINGYIEIDGRRYLQLTIRAAPENGKANEEIISFLSKEWKIPKSRLEIVSGHRSKIKILSIS